MDLSWHRWDEKPVDGQRILAWLDEDTCVAGRYRRKSKICKEGVESLGVGGVYEVNGKGCWAYLPLPPKHIVEVETFRFSRARK